MGTALFEDYLQSVKGKIKEPDHEYSKLVKKVASRLASVVDNLTYPEGSSKPKFSWEFIVVDDPAVNAFCMPSGKVVVNSGLIDKLVEKVASGTLSDLESALAIPLGHEIGHAVGRHSSNMISYMPFGFILGNMVSIVAPAFQTAFQLGFLSYSREHEKEADYIGIRLCAMACFNVTMGQYTSPLHSVV
jgi:predicted Zn-dependent protease